MKGLSGVLVAGIVGDGECRFSRRTLAISAVHPIASLRARYSTANVTSDESSGSKVPRVADRLLWFFDRILPTKLLHPVCTFTNSWTSELTICIQHIKYANFLSNSTLRESARRATHEKMKDDRESFTKAEATYWIRWGADIVATCSWIISNSAI